MLGHPCLRAAAAAAGVTPKLQGHTWTPGTMQRLVGWLSACDRLLASSSALAAARSIVVLCCLGCCDHSYEKQHQGMDVGWSLQWC